MHIKNQPGIKPNTEVLGGRTTRQSMVVYLVIKPTNIMLRGYETEMHFSLFRTNLFLEHQSDSKSTFDCIV
jgi:hypothetical protein